MLRCEEPGWIRVAVADGRRGLWYRRTDHGVEVCAGREGDDEHATLTGDAGELAALVACLDAMAWASDVASDPVGHDPRPDDERPAIPRCELDRQICHALANAYGDHPTRRQLRTVVEAVVVGRRKVWDRGIAEGIRRANEKNPRRG